ncbi:hypothetical protein [Povalibacter sp.]|uniref:hypothetical protein n=1 Tax=Povalibacter sp. TaxID=1962978 RepID=UPI002F40D152
MHAEVLRWFLSPLRLWRTIFLIFGVGFAVASITRDPLAVLCAASACAYVFSGSEQREWIVRPAHVRAGDTLARISLVFIATFTL